MRASSTLVLAPSSHLHLSHVGKLFQAPAHRYGPVGDLAELVEHPVDTGVTALSRMARRSCLLCRRRPRTATKSAQRIGQHLVAMWVCTVGLYLTLESSSA